MPSQISNPYSSAFNENPYESPPNPLPNVALNRAATAYSTYDGGSTPDRAVNGDRTGYGWSAANVGVPGWFQIDLGQPYHISGYALWKEAVYNGMPNRNIRGWSFQRWDSIQDAWIDLDVVSNDASDISTRSFTEVVTQIVRIFITDCQNWEFPALTEFEVYGYIPVLKPNGDVLGNGTLTKVKAIQGVDIADITPVEGQVLGFTTGVWQPVGGGSNPGASLTNSAEQAALRNEEHYMTMDTVIEDTGDFVDPSFPNRFTIPAGKDGRYLLTALVNWTTQYQGNGNRSVFFVKNRTLKFAVDTSNGGNFPLTQQLTRFISLEEGDYIELEVINTATSAGEVIGVGVDIGPFFSIQAF